MTQLAEAQSNDVVQLKTLVQKCTIPIVDCFFEILNENETISKKQFKIFSEPALHQMIKNGCQADAKLLRYGLVR